MYPDDRRYTREHEWAKREDGRIRVGITKFAADRLSDVVFIELPKVGAEVRAMEPFGVIESVKAASDLYAPVSGRVVEVNQQLVDSPEMINQDPHGAAWMVVIEPSGDEAWDGLLDAAAYGALVGAEH
ncbi:MAG: glycine cleavage system protein GcvH [Armatimonadota bacterium]|nr:glycine cleavage system protein GcvH [Armatimonadota bacterium]MDR7421016.1 glycine cleavage system protein GcvH [Armatimonadota bacterium]MDR7453286.1 glycine cleavage system protein GcvH [Armatimonadota bacterium]MDR7457404.1 glycine cleavage system protein GcvH [Armatimonadota bacterium]MDR7497419.1 glycine cleavage system protein GcvH [Armatimonadota bacterium]